MTLNHEANAALIEFGGSDAPTESVPTPEEMRFAHLDMVVEPTEDCHEIRDLDAGGVAARLYSPKPSDETPGLLVFMHGGGWVTGNLDTHDDICRFLTNRSGHGVLSVDYRLAPENPFPAGLDDCVIATEWAYANADTLGFDPARICVGGDSAGGNLAAVVCHEASVPISFQLLFYPITDCRAGSDSYRDKAEGYFLTAEIMHWFFDQYLAGEQGSVQDSRVSPLLASDEVLAKCPPCLIITAGYDPLCDEGAQYADRLTELGVEVSHVEFPGQIHGFVSMSRLISEGRTALALAAEALVATAQGTVAKVGP